MIGVGIDVSKLKSTICILNEYGEVLQTPYEISHTETDLKELSKSIKGYGGKNDVRVVMEATGAYIRPILYYLLDEDIFVSEINPLAMKKYRADINFRGVKNDRIDAMAIAQYTVEKWNRLKEYQRADNEYAAMKALSRQYLSYMKPHVILTQNLDHLIDQVMPGIKKEFDGYDSVTGKDRLADFLEEFRHYDYITSLGPKKFEERFDKWAKKKGYHPRQNKPNKIYSLAKEGIPTLAYDPTSRLLVEQAVAALKGLNQVLYQIFPCKTACTIYFENKNRNVKIDGYVETLEGDLFSMQERIQISIICPRPYFEDLNAIYTEISTTIKRFSFPFSISQPIPLGEVLDTPHAFITNFGDTDTGFTLTGEITKALTTFTITNLTTGAYFTLNYAFAAGDIITLCTIQGRLSVQIQRSGAVINLLNKVDENSSWIKLQAGYNDLTFSCGEEDPDFPLAITALWLYGGV